MAPDPNPSMEELLKRYARQRRSEGGSFELPLETRQRLHDEVARVYPKAAPAPSRRPFLAFPWPRFFVLGGATAALLLSATVYYFSGGQLYSPERARLAKTDLPPNRPPIKAESEWLADRSLTSPESQALPSPQKPAADQPVIEALRTSSKDVATAPSKFLGVETDRKRKIIDQAAEADKEKKDSSKLSSSPRSYNLANGPAAANQFGSRTAPRSAAPPNTGSNLALKDDALLAKGPAPSGSAGAGSDIGSVPFRGGGLGGGGFGGNRANNSSKPSTSPSDTASTESLKREATVASVPNPAPSAPPAVPVQNPSSAVTAAAADAYAPVGGLPDQRLKKEALAESKAFYFAPGAAGPQSLPVLTAAPNQQGALEGELRSLAFSNQAQGFGTVALRRESSTRFLTAHEVQPPAVLQNFYLSQQGPRVQIVDADGSVYTGAVLNATPETQFANRPANPLTLSRDLKDGNLGAEQASALQQQELQQRSQQQQLQQPFANQNLFFRASGTNRTRNQLVLIEANLQTDTNALGPSAQLGAKTAVMSNGAIAGGQSRIQGQAWIARTNTLNIEAVENSRVPAAPPATRR